MMNVKCWYYDVSELFEASAFSRAMSLLPWEERREKVLRYKFEKDRALCLGAGLLAAHALRDSGARDLRMLRTVRGKPCLAHDSRLHFNISHSGRIAVCAVSDKPVGVDTELYMKPEDGIADIVLSDDETEWLERQADKDKAFIMLWTRKESLLKMTGEGIADTLKAVSVIPRCELPDGYVFTERDIAEQRVCVCSAGTAEFERTDSLLGQGDRLF